AGPWPQPPTTASPSRSQVAWSASPVAQPGNLVGPPVAQPGNLDLVLLASGRAPFPPVARAGVEPATFRFSGGRSYQLSYLSVTARIRSYGTRLRSRLSGCNELQSNRAG